MNQTDFQAFVSKMRARAMDFILVVRRPYAISTKSQKIYGALNGDSPEEIFNLLLGWLREVGLLQEFFNWMQKQKEEDRA